MTMTIELDWTKYPNFFELWRAERHATKLLYVIGDEHHCYARRGSRWSQVRARGRYGPTLSLRTAIALRISARASAIDTFSAA
jgi:hypothetical protein